MKRIIRLTERDLTRIVRRVLKEETSSEDIIPFTKDSVKLVKVMDSKKNNILSSYDVPDGNLKIKLKPVNLIYDEKIEVRILFDNKLKLSKTQEDIIFIPVATSIYSQYSFKVDDEQEENGGKAFWVNIDNVENGGIFVDVDFDEKSTVLYR